jgi:hypothetical protein
MDCWTKYIFIDLPLFNVDGLDGFYHVHSVDDDIFKLQSAMESGSLGTDENIAIWHRYTKAKFASEDNGTQYRAMQRRHILGRYRRTSTVYRPASSLQSVLLHRTLIWH